VCQSGGRAGGVPAGADRCRASPLAARGTALARDEIAFLVGELSHSSDVHVDVGPGASIYSPGSVAASGWAAVEQTADGRAACLQAIVVVVVVVFIVL